MALTSVIIFNVCPRGVSGSVRSVVESCDVDPLLFYRHTTSASEQAQYVYVTILSVFTPRTSKQTPLF